MHPLEQGMQEHGPETEAAARLRTAFEHLRNPMLIVDDHRWCVTANAPACGLLDIEPTEVPWRRIDDFAPAAARSTLADRWEAFLAHGAVEGWYHLPLPTGRVVSVEFSATANVLPGRHLSVVMARPGVPEAHTEPGWVRVASPAAGPQPLTAREQEVLGLVAAGLRGGEIAQYLLLSPETIKSHVQNAMTRLGAHTRAHAVAIALRTGQIGAPALAPAPELDW